MRRPFEICLVFALVLFLGTTVTVAVRLGAQEAAPAPRGRDTQPIAFSHREHVTEVGLDCQLCHAYARRGPIAGIPSGARCVGCHRFVLPDSPEVAKILRYQEDEEPIPWVRVHDLPEHVRFTHKRHVRAGVTCEECHGEVGRMEIVEQVAPLTMGWCITCHQDRQAPLDCLTCH